MSAAGRATSPTTKTARQALVRELVEAAAVASQPALAALLAERGVQVTQATLSRDLEDLGASRVRDARGGARYVVPPDGAVPAEPVGGRLDARLSRLLSDLLVSVEPVAAGVVLRCPPGAAQFLGSHLDRAGLPEVAGTIAGDDTVLLVTRDDAGPSPAATRLAEDLRRRSARDPAAPDIPSDDQVTSDDPTSTDPTPTSRSHA